MKVFGKLFSIIMICLMVFGGCTSADNREIITENQYYIYYLTTSGNKLSPVEYSAKSTDTDKLVGELMQQFMTVPKDVDAMQALDNKVTYNGYSLDKNILTLNFDSNYSSMKTVREVLCNAALAKTMTQISGIEYINIYSGNEPLADKDNVPVGLLSGNDFVEQISDVNAFSKTTLTLYFADETGKKLIAETREVVYDMNTPMEQLVIEQLIKGPTSRGLIATLPAATKVLGVTVSDTVCTVNMNTEFLKNIEGVNGYVTIYSIVNSLSGLPSVRKVQFQVNNSQDVMFRDSISLSELFEKNEEYLADPNQ